MANRELTPKDILEKDFKTSMRGYNPTEVDEFLDIVIRDYESFSSEINHLKTENQRLMTKVDELAKQSQASPSSSGQGATTVTNFDILKRLSNLERHVFGSKLNDE
ncbi:cell division regulator GpsB [Atopococcus tabaci]|uniref:cell division regulator GpsB n=1 Tax=Atopococcus tabaci TaxID=269774 RepID=UPI0003FC9A76|nr:cell division regulator GpsB [Atopococcus tabaci]